MNKLKKQILLSLLLFGSGFTFIPSVHAQDNNITALTDIRPDHWAYNSLLQLIEKYHLKLGYPDNTFRGNKPVTRYETAALLLQVLQHTEKKALETSDKEIIESLKKEFVIEISSIKMQLEALQDQTDINSTTLDQLSQHIELFDQALNFRLFGSLAIRNCSMATNIISEPQNIIKNLQGNRFQTRIGGGITGDFADDFNYQLRILTIDNNSFNLPWLPVSTNLVRLPFLMDRYFISYVPSKLTPKHSLQLTFGKAINFLPETELLFDEDVSFSGFSQQYAINNITPWFKQLSFGLSENILLTEGVYDTTYMLGAKVGIDSQPADKFSVKTGASYLHYIGEKNMAKFQFPTGYNGTTSITNRLDSTQNAFQANFNLLDAFLKFRYNFNDRLPLEIYGDFVHNFGAADKNQGYLFGASLGDMKQTGDLFFNYNYKSLAQDYNLAFFVQDQMGGTDVSGHQFDVGAQIAAKTRLLFTFQQRASISSSKNPNLYILYSSIRQDF